MANIILCDICNDEMNTKDYDAIIGSKTMHDDITHEQVDICPRCTKKIKSYLLARKQSYFNSDLEDTNPIVQLAEAIFGE